MSTPNKTFFETAIDRIYQEDSFSPKMYAQVRLSKAYMEKFYIEKIQLDDIAKTAFLSRFHYVRVFQRMYGVTPRAYLRDIRVLKAKKLLKKGEPITAVCFGVGYDSLPTFSSVFKKCTGYTPKDYQRINKAI
ncbi:AraC family transcriptional regulator [Thalassotalea sp. 1_MG-2023]|uniref:helix-turn-helix domain-containing protein n=1 Tax=Thalassotalea sp. 1_MG-2023 TaxID=3062680 RepID=UPI0026E15780|nr:AraC family transcriptional regulator [Thalassotalea sp. 1_MG-2023]MDO6428551.1 AraC family transcriptional regulator [Thalassotalea sp. 1_MG-2023]